MALKFTRHRVIVWLLAFITAPFAAGAVQAASFVWPDTSAPCNGSLQACIDGIAAPSVLYIATDNVTNTGVAGEDVLLQRSVSLAAANGYRPVFPVGIGIVSTPAATIEISISGITLRDAGIRILPWAGGSFYVEHMQLIDNVGGNGIDFESLGSASAYLRVHDNSYLRRGGAGNFLALKASSAPISGEVSFNQVSIPDSGSSAYGMVFSATGSGSFDFTVANNELRSGFAFGAICALSNAPTGTPTASNIRIFGHVLVPLRLGSGTAICVFGGEGAIDAKISHNTVVGFGNAIALVTRPFSPPASVQPISGYVIGNLLAHNNTALRRDGIAALPGDAVTNGQNLFFDNNTDFGGTSPATAGSGTVNADPLLYSLQYPYLKAGSPAIGRGNGLALPPGLALLDVDGTRRLKNVTGGGGNIIDIGAYEFGDDWYNTRANGTNNSGNTLHLTHPANDANQSARALVTPNYELGGVSNYGPFGVFYNTSNSLWSVFNQSIATTMPNGAGYSAFTPATGSGLFLHQVAAAGPTQDEAVLDSSAVNALPNQIVVATSNWNPATAGGVYNNHNIAVAFEPDERWRIRNSDGAVFANAAAFNVYAQPPSVSAFRHITSARNISSSTTVVDNPRLNGFSCAELMVTPRSSFGNRQFDVYFDNNTARWQIFAPGGMPVDAEFNVVFSPRQIAECGRPLFASGFEN